MKRIYISLLSAAILMSGVFAERVLFDVDFTKGNAGGGTATGGTWDGGWRVTGKGQRIVFNAGYPIKSGYIEAKVTTNKLPPAGDYKMNHYGVYECANLQHASCADKGYLRLGKSKYGFSRFKAGGKIFNKTGCVTEHSMGRISDWKTDDKTIHTMKMRWGKGNIWYSGTGASGEVSGNKCIDQYPIDKIQFAFLGQDKTYSQTAFVGIRYLSFIMVDLDGSGGAVSTSRTPVSANASMTIVKTSSGDLMLTALNNRNAAPVNVEIRGLDGRIIHSEKLNAETGGTISTQGIAAGSYLLQVTGAAQALRRNVVIE